MKGGPRDTGNLSLQSQSELLSSPPWRIYRLGQLTLAFSVCPPRRSLTVSLHLGRGFSHPQLAYESKARCTRPIRCVIKMYHIGSVFALLKVPLLEVKKVQKELGKMYRKNQTM